ncbi:MAG TPA: transketolase [Candidatus Eremiobacteraceae bacterium]|jgi:transketolase
MTMPDARVIELEERANTIRQDIIEMLVEAGSGHSAGPLDMADVFAALYFHTMRHRPDDPSWPDRDRLILSCGHICPVRYAAMARAGYFPVSELMTLRKFGSPLQGHPERTRLPGSETTSGPLGAGLAQSCGLAYAARMDGKAWRTYCVTSDAEHQAGLHWEAAFFAGKYRLNNITCIIDRNNIQIGGDTEEIMPLEPLREKYESFRWHVLEIDGNNMRRVVDALEEVKSIHEKPTVIIAHTVPGKGVDFMEGDYLWHGKPPTSQQAQVALEELRAVAGKLRAEHE